MKLNEELLGKLLTKFVLENIQFARVGSSTIEGTNPDDFDILVLDNGELEDFFMTHTNFDYGGSNLEEEEFKSFKAYNNTPSPEYEDPLNIILAKKEDFYNKFIDANDICKSAKLVNKANRIEVFNYIFNREDKPSSERFADLAIGNVPKEVKVESCPF